MNAYIKKGCRDGAIVDPDGIVKATTIKTSTNCVLDIPDTELVFGRRLKNVLLKMIPIHS